MDDKLYDLADAVLEPPPADGKKLPRPKIEHTHGGLWISARIKAKLNGVSPPALAVLCCLLDLAFKARVWGSPGEPLALSNMAVAKWGVSRGQKRPALDELERRGILTYTQTGKESPRVETGLAKVSITKSTKCMHEIEHSQSPTKLHRFTVSPPNLEEISAIGALRHQLACNVASPG